MKQPLKNGYHPSIQADKTQREQGFYNTQAWRRLRIQALNRDHHLCQLRTSPKCTGIATEVHHIKALKDNPDLGLNLDNLTSCCWWCHEETKNHSRPGVNRQKKKATVPIIPGVRIIRICDGSENEPEKETEGGMKIQ